MKHVMLWLSCAAALLAGCGREDTGAEKALEESATAAEAVAADEGAGRDLSAVDVCALIPADTVAAAVGGTTEGAPAATDPGFDGKGCRYEYRAGGILQAANVSLHPPSQCDFWRDMQSFPLEDIAGIGDRAFWGKRTGETNVYVLKSGDVCVHVAAHAQELAPAQAIAEAVLNRL